jgi:hypothetical protein
VRDARATGEQTAENQKETEDDKSFHKKQSVSSGAENCKRVISRLR